MKFGRPAKYCITVGGNLDASWADRLGDMTITESSQEGQDVMTTLVGRVLDQVAETLGALLGGLLPLRRDRTNAEEGVDREGQGYQPEQPEKELEAEGASDAVEPT